MQAALVWQDSASPPAAESRLPSPAPPTLPPELEAVLWHGDELGTPVSSVVPSGWERLNAELPGGGWPCHAVTEVLQPQPSLCEWRLLGPALRSIVAAGQTIALVGPPKQPHLPGLQHEGLDDQHLVWIQAETPAERLWTTEQLVKANACGALLAWLPQARPEQLRRLQVAAAACEGLVVLLRPEAARHEASPAPLRVLASVDVDWALQLQILKRKGPRLDMPLTLPSIPGGLDAVLPPRLRVPSRLLTVRQPRADDVLGRTAAGSARRRSLAA
jgi:protein ImuA